MTVARMTLDEFHATLKAQGVEKIEDAAVVCPMCKCVQSARDLMEASGKDFEAIRNYIGFSCYGRWLGAPSPRKKPDGKPCDWTLGGLFTLHKLEVEMPDGVTQPAFEPASPEQAQAHAAEHARRRGES